MRFTTRGDAKNLDALAGRLAGAKANTAKRRTLAIQLRQLNPHLDDFENLPPETPILVPDDANLDPRATEALRIADEALQAARNAIQSASAAAATRDEQRETDLRREREDPANRDDVKAIDAELTRLGARRDVRKQAVERVGATLEKTAEKVGRVGRR